MNVPAKAANDPTRARLCVEYSWKVLDVEWGEGGTKNFPSIFLNYRILLDISSVFDRVEHTDVQMNAAFSSDKTAQEKERRNKTLS